MNSTNTILNKTVLYDGDYIWVKPLCDFFGLSVRHQYRKIKKEFFFMDLSSEEKNLRTFSEETTTKESNLRTKKYADEPENTPEMRKKYADFGIIDQNGRILLTKQGFLRWVWSINPDTIKEELRDSMVLYQDMIHEYLFSHVRLENELKTYYHQLNQMEEQRNALNKEIRKSKRAIDKLMDERFGQLSIGFEEAQELPA